MPWVITYLAHTLHLGDHFLATFLNWGSRHVLNCIGIEASDDWCIRRFVDSARRRMDDISTYFKKSERPTPTGSLSKPSYQWWSLDARYFRVTPKWYRIPLPHLSHRASCWPYEYISFWTIMDNERFYILEHNIIPILLIPSTAIERFQTLSRNTKLVRIKKVSERILPSFRNSQVQP